MARKERNNIDYFPHSVSHGKKMFYLRSKYKNDGYTVWFMLLEELGKSEYHYLDLSDDIQLMYLSSEFMVSEIILKEIINILVKFGEFNAELWSNESILFNEKFIDNISDAYKKRNNDCITKKSLSSLLIAKGRIKQPKSTPNQSIHHTKGGINPQRIVKDSKEEDSKEEEIEIFDEDKFNEAFKLYNKKTNIQEAKSEYYELTSKEKELILIHIPKWIKNHQETDKMTFLPNFSNYLLKKRWLEDLPYKTTVNNFTPKLELL